MSVIVLNYYGWIIDDVNRKKRNIPCVGVLSSVCRQTWSIGENVFICLCQPKKRVRRENVLYLHDIPRGGDGTGVY